jgi:hypothetical protein
VKKKILKNIPKIWHLSKGDLPKIIIIQQPSDEPARGLWYLCPKMVFLASKTLLSLSSIVEKNFFFNFECYDIANGKE